MSYVRIATDDPKCNERRPFQCELKFSSLRELELFTSVLCVERELVVHVVRYYCCWYIFSLSSNSTLYPLLLLFLLSYCTFFVHLIYRLVCLQQYFRSLNHLSSCTKKTASITIFCKYNKGDTLNTFSF